MTPPVTPSKNATTSQQSTATPDDVRRHTGMADVASDVLRMRKVKQKLDSVLVNVKYFLASAFLSFDFPYVRNLVCLSILSHLQDTPQSPNYMNTGMLRTPGVDSLMFQTPRRPDSVAYPGSLHPGKRPGGVTFQFPESTGRSFRQGMGKDVSLSTWGSDFSSTMDTAYGTSAQSPTLAQVGDGDMCKLLLLIIED